MCDVISCYDDNSRHKMTDKQAECYVEKICCYKLLENKLNHERYRKSGKT